jgi:hypothetical protein
VQTLHLVLEHRGYKHHKVYPSQLLCTSCGSFVQALRLPNVHGPETNNFRSWSRSGNILGHCLCFLNIAAYDAGIGAEVNESAHLGAADRAGAAGAEDDFVV